MGEREICSALSPFLLVSVLVFRSNNRYLVHLYQYLHRVPALRANTSGKIVAKERSRSFFSQI